MNKDLLNTIFIRIDDGGETYSYRYYVDGVEGTLEGDRIEFLEIAFTRLKTSHAERAELIAEARKQNEWLSQEDISPRYTVVLDGSALALSDCKFFDNFNFNNIKRGEVIYLEDLESVGADYAVLTVHAPEFGTVYLEAITSTVAEALEAREELGI